jgi:hypothetical protein
MMDVKMVYMLDMVEEVMQGDEVKLLMIYLRSLIGKD